MIDLYLLRNGLLVLLEFLNVLLYHLLMDLEGGASPGYGGVPLPQKGHDFSAALLAHRARDRL